MQLVIHMSTRGKRYIIKLLNSYLYMRCLGITQVLINWEDLHSQHDYACTSQLRRLALTAWLCLHLPTDRERPVFNIHCSSCPFLFITTCSGVSACLHRNQVVQGSTPGPDNFLSCNVLIPNITATGRFLPGIISRFWYWALELYCLADHRSGNPEIPLWHLPML